MSLQNQICCAHVVLAAVLKELDLDGREEENMCHSRMRGNVKMMQRLLCYSQIS